jgi:hypothetical protein
MVDAARSEAWQHTAWIMCMIANVNRDAKKRPRPFSPDEFNPMAVGSKKKTGSDAIVITKETVGQMREAFGGLSRRKKQIGPVKAGPQQTKENRP